MICEKCQVSEATTHSTHNFPLQPDTREPATVVRQHLCQNCASAFKREFEQFLHELPQYVRQGMSKQERWEANRPLREALERYVREWSGTGHST